MHALIWLVALLCLGCGGPSSPALLTAYGSAIVQAPPEKFDISLRVRSRERDPGLAQATNQKKLDGVKQLLLKQQVKSADFVIDDNTLTLEEPEDGVKTVREAQFVAEQRISVTFPIARDREQLFVSASRRHLAEITGQSEGLLEPAKLRNEARLEAIRQARGKAEAMAAELHQSLGEAYAVEEENDNGYLSAGSNSRRVIPPPDHGFEGSGLVEESARVKVSFILKPK